MLKGPGAPFPVIYFLDFFFIIWNYSGGAAKKILKKISPRVNKSHPT